MSDGELTRLTMAGGPWSALQLSGQMRPVMLVVAAATFGAWAFPATAAPLSPEDAKGHIGETATVCGLVASAEYEGDVRSQPTLLDLGKPLPNAIFTAVIYRENPTEIWDPRDLAPRQAHLCHRAD